MPELQTFINIWLKFFFVLTPFFVLSMFISMTNGWSVRQKLILALRVIFASLVACTILFFFGNWVFSAFGITIDAFRIGGGALLFLSAVSLVNGAAAQKSIEHDADSDIAVVPLAIPVTIGPGTTAAILVMGAEPAEQSAPLLGFAALLFALLCLGGVLLCASQLERIFGRRGIAILSKLTGLVLAALAAQMIFTGIQNFLPAIR